MILSSFNILNPNKCALMLRSPNILQLVICFSHPLPRLKQEYSVIPAKGKERRQKSKHKDVGFYLQSPPDKWGAHCHRRPAEIKLQLVESFQFWIGCTKSTSVFAFPLWFKKKIPFTFTHMNQNRTNVTMCLCLAGLECLTCSIFPCRQIFHKRFVYKTASMFDEFKD